MKIIKLLIPLLLLSGCASIQLGEIQEINSNAISLVDNRDASEKNEYQQGVSILLGDTSFDKNPTLYLKESLYRNKPPTLTAVNFEITKFRLIDYFPERARIAMAGALSGALSSMGYTVVGDPSGDSDSIICALEGTLNGNPVVSSSIVPYRISPFAMQVRNQPEFVAAVKKSINICVENAFKQIK